MILRREKRQRATKEEARAYARGLRDGFASIGKGMASIGEAFRPVDAENRQKALRERTLQARQRREHREHRLDEALAAHGLPPLDLMSRTTTQALERDRRALAGDFARANDRRRSCRSER